MKIVLVALLGVLVLGAAGYFVGAQLSGGAQAPASVALDANKHTQKGVRDSDVQALPGGKASSSVSAEKFSEDEQLIDRLEVMSERRPNVDFDPEAVAAAMQRKTAWTPIKEIPKNLPLEPELLNDGRKFFRFDELKLETLVPGDTVKVNLEEVGQEYEVAIDSVEKHDYDSISWHGHIETGDGQTYRVNFTRGGNLTVGGLSTPEGHYVVQSHGDTGWIASSALLFKIDPDQPDVIYPEDVMRQEAQSGEQGGASPSHDGHDHD